jgi:PncC family amidohydrolase
MIVETEGVARYLSEHGLTLATAESCTAGLIASMLADVAGAGQLLECAFVVYSPQAKMRCLGLRRETLERYNLTSQEVAREMALGASRRCMASVIVANTGVVDDGGEGVEPGTQCYAWLFRAPDSPRPRIYTETHQFNGGRTAVRRLSATYALLRLVHYHGQ